MIDEAWATPTTLTIIREARVANPTAIASNVATACLEVECPSAAGRKWRVNHHATALSISAKKPPGL
jgi:hypothetical protein